jgi:hypothetical protein
MYVDKVIGFKMMGHRETLSGIGKSFSKVIYTQAKNVKVFQLLCLPAST